MKAFSVLGATFAMIATLTGPASAANPASGEQLARQWCTNCHVIAPNADTTTQQGPPSLPAVATSGMSAEQLRGFLIHPHGEMPNLSLSRAEIDDLIAYIQSLH